MIRDSALASAMVMEKLPCSPSKRPPATPAIPLSNPRIPRSRSAIVEVLSGVSLEKPQAEHGAAQGRFRYPSQRVLLKTLL